jgi:iron complex transport system ATP-binding protein
MISINGLQVKSAAGKILVQKTSFELSEFKVVGLFGPNGSGKSSLLMALAGQGNGRIISGENNIDQKNIFSNSISALEKSQKILYLGSDFQTPFQISVRELLDMAKEVNPLSRENVAEVAERFGIAALLFRSFDEMSDGEKQRVMLARGVIQSPRWLVLDETFSKVDLDHSFQLAEELRGVIGKGRGVILSSHDLNLLSEMVDELWLMKDGKILAAGLVEDVLTTENIQLLYPLRKVHVMRSPYNGKKKVIY